MARQPVIKAAIQLHTDGERLVLIIKSASGAEFQDLLMKVRATSASFDWDERVWYLPLTKRNADKVIAMAAGENVEIAPLLAAWIADRSYLERLAALEAAVAQLQEAFSRTAAEPPF